MTKPPATRGRPTLGPAKRVPIHCHIDPRTLELLDQLVRDDSTEAYKSSRGRVLDDLIRRAAEVAG